MNESLANDEPLPASTSTPTTPQVHVRSRSGFGVSEVLAIREYRWFWIGNFLSNIGSWMQNVALGWLVLQLTDSAFYLGLETFTAFVPSVLFVLVGGVAADRSDRKKLMILTQGCMLVLALCLGILTSLQYIHIGLILIIAFCSGTASSLYAPAGQAVLPDLVPREKLPQAVALNSAQFNLSRILGPALAGYALAYLGTEGCFYLNATSFLALIVAIYRIRIPGPTVSPTNQSNWQQFRSGITYLTEHKELLAFTLLIGAESFFLLSAMSMFPLFARDILFAGARGLSHLTSALGVGALVGALLLMQVTRRRNKGKLIVASLYALSGLIFLFSFCRIQSLSLVLLTLSGFFMVTANATMTNLMQTLSPGEFRGRVMSIFITSSLGLLPFGSLCLGALSEGIGVQRSVAMFALFSLLATWCVMRYLPKLTQVES